MSSSFYEHVVDHEFKLVSTKEYSAHEAPPINIEMMADGTDENEDNGNDDCVDVMIYGDRTVMIKMIVFII